MVGTFLRGLCQIANSFRRSISTARRTAASAVSTGQSTALKCPASWERPIHDQHAAMSVVAAGLGTLSLDQLGPRRFVWQHRPLDDALPDGLDQRVVGGRLHEYS